jgi:serine protease Do
MNRLRTERNRLSARLSLAVALLAVSVSVAGAVDTTAVSPPATAVTGAEGYRAQVARAREAVLPYVVSILAVREDYLQGEASLSLSGGSGTVISAEGHVLTNAHVTQQGRSFRVVFADGVERRARLVGEDPLSDIAVLAVEEAGGQRFEHARFAAELDVAAGDPVLAMGAPWGYSQSLSMGVVNHPRRLLASLFQDEADYEESIGPDQPTGRYYAWIQHDAPISPGNSGGPLVDLEGRIVGVNTRGSVFGGDMAFAIPGPEAERIARTLIEHGEVPRADIGVRLRSLAGTGFSDGVIVNSVRPGSPADRAGIRVGDRIVAVAGRRYAAARAEDVPDLLRALAELPVGRPVAMSVARGKVARQRRVTPVAAGPERGNEGVLGAFAATGVELTDAMAARRGLAEPRGVQLTGLRPGGAAATARPPLAAGDIVRSIDGRAVAGLVDVPACTTQAGPAPLLVRVERNRAELAVLLVPAPCAKVDVPQPELPKPWLGVDVQPVTAMLAARLGLGERAGYRISRVYPGSAYVAAGGQVGDLVVAIGGDALAVVNDTDTSRFEQRVRNADDTVPLALSVVRAGRSLELTATLASAPLRADAMRVVRLERFGLRARDIGYFDRIERGLAEDRRGVVVDLVESGGLGGLAHLVAGDVILAVDDETVTGVDTLRRLLEAAVARDAAGAVALTVQRGRETRMLYLQRNWVVP